MDLSSIYVFKSGRWQRLSDVHEKLRLFFLKNNQLQYISLKAVTSGRRRIQPARSFIVERRRRKRHRRRRRNNDCHNSPCCPCAQAEGHSNLQQQPIVNNNIQIVQDREPIFSQPRENAPKTNTNEVLPKSSSIRSAKEPLPVVKDTSEKSDHDSDSSMTNSIAACKEIVIDLDDVDCVKDFLLKNPLAFPEINRRGFVKNETYRKNCLFKIHPTVKIEKQDRLVIDEKLHDSHKAEFAAGLGLACKTQTPKATRKTSSESEETSDGSSSETEPPAKRPRRIGLGLARKTRTPKATRKISSSETSNGSSSEAEPPAKRLSTRRTSPRRLSTINVTPKKKQNSSSGSGSDSDNDLPQRKQKSARIANKTPATVIVSSDSSSSTSESDEGSVQVKRAQRAGRATKRDDARPGTGRRSDDTSVDGRSVQVKGAQRAGGAMKRNDARGRRRGEDNSDSGEGLVQAKRAQRAGRATKRDDARPGTSDDTSDDEGSVQAKRAQRAGRATKRDDARRGTGRHSEDTSDSDEGSVQAKRAQRACRATKRDDARPWTGRRSDDTSASSGSSGSEFQTKNTSKKENMKPTRRTNEQGKPKSTEPKASNNASEKKTTKQTFQKKHNTSVNGRDYSSLEDHAIVSWISVGGRERLVNGNRVWRELATSYMSITGHARSWHSLRNRYLRYILPSLGLLCLDPALQTKLRSGATKGEIKLKRKNSLNRPNSLLQSTSVLSAWSKKPRVLRSESVTPRAIEESKTRRSPSPILAPNNKKRVSLGSPTYSEVTRAFADKRLRSSMSSEVSRGTPTLAVPETKLTRSRKLFTNKPI